MEKRIAILDIETDNLLPDLTKVWCAVVKEYPNGESISFTPNTTNNLCSYLNNYTCLIGHNIIQFDLPALKKVFGWEWKGEIIDTLLMSRLQRPKRLIPPHVPNKKVGPHSIEAWGWRVGRGKVQYDDWHEYTSEMLRRCQEDVEITQLVYEALLKEGQGEGWGFAHKLTAQLFQILQRTEEYGWNFDINFAHHCIHLLDHWISRIDNAVKHSLPTKSVILETKKEGEYNYVKKPFLKSGDFSSSVTNHCSNGDWLQHISGPFSRIKFRPIDLDSNLETKQFLLKLGWEPEEWNEDAYGNRRSPKLSKSDGFKGIQGSLGRLIAKRVQCRQRKGVIEGLLQNVRSDGRISSVINGIAVTGRAKHSVIANIPNPESGAFFSKQMRSLFISSPGKVLVGVDSKGNQIRQLAARLNDEEFTQAVLHGTKEDGTDLHSLNQRRSGAPTRTRAKNFFYGFIFGAGDKKIGQVVDGTAEDGRKLKETYLREMPALAVLIQKLTQEWRSHAKKWKDQWGRWIHQDGWVTGLDGRRIYVDKEHKILNYVLQSDEAIQMSLAIIMFDKWMTERGYVWGKDYAIVNWYHDEWTTDCRPEIATEIGDLGSEAIRWAGEWFRIQCPHEGNYKVGRSWYDIH